MEGFYTDEWGVGHTKSKNTELHFEHMIAPLKYARSVNDIMDFPLPDFMEDYRHAHFEEEVGKLHEQGLAVAGPLTQTLFEQAWLIRGFEDLMTDMLENEDMVECLLDRLLDLRIKMAERYAAVGVDVLMLGDDIAMQIRYADKPCAVEKMAKAQTCIRYFQSKGNQARPAYILSFGWQSADDYR